MLSDLGGSTMLSIALTALLVLTAAIPGGAALPNIVSGLPLRINAK